MTQVSSGLINTQIPTSGALSVACAMASADAKTFKPNARPPLAMAEVPTMKLRRDNVEGEAVFTL
jgi:hypothetical protein